MKITSKIFLFLLLVINFSCEEQGLIVKCPDCLPDEPVKTELEIKLENSSYYPDALIQVWEGNIEDSILLSSNSLRAYATTYKQEVILNKKYTISVTYYFQNDTYIAIDSATPRVKYNKDQCDEPCYFVYDKVLDLRLKYTR
jgi:hypothetical protein